MGLALGRGVALETALAEIQQVVEGVQSSREARLLAQRQGIDMPIVEQVHAVLHEGRSPREAVRQLLERQQKAEFV